MPTAMQDAFARIASEAGLPAPKVVLRFRMKPRAHSPVVRGSWLGQRTVRLTLPLADESFFHAFLLFPVKQPEIACDSSPSACLTTLVLLS